MTNKPYKIYGADYIEASALQQMDQAMAQLSVVKGALMPDAHHGYTLPIGGVVATKGTIYPSFVGYDIGCGMCAIKTPFSVNQMQPKVEEIFHSIYRSIPTGLNQYNSRPIDWNPDLPHTKTMERIYKKKGRVQLGSLGSGNHFIEVSADNNDDMWIVIHSGSRGVGHQTATHYMQVASNGKAKEGFYPLDAEAEQGQNYIIDLRFCLEFALANRREMLRRVLKDLNHAINRKAKVPTNVDWDTLINRNHNQAELKDGLWIQRKGATHAEKGMLGVIPGNMQIGSFIVEGKGNEDSLCSSSHGAGRLLSRKRAKEDLNMDRFRSSMTGIQALVAPGTLDESPAAYKNVERVLAAQTDLVTVKAHLKPLINIKAQEGGRGKRGRRSR